MLPKQIIFYDNEDILLETDPQGNILTRFTHGPGIDEPLVMERGGQSYFYHTDGLGSVTAITDSSGTITNTYTYDSFGSIVEQSGSLANPYTYTAREYDSESGLLYYRARYYDARIGRFLQEDPLRYVNLYVYCSNSPINWVDPYGLDKQKKDKPWWQKLEEGYYFGTGFGQEAAEWYAQQQLQTGNPLWAIPGSVASLWTPETYQGTAWTLVTAGALSGWAAQTGPWAGRVVIHPPHLGGPHQYWHIQIMARVGEHITKHIRIPPHWLMKFFGY